MSATITSQGEMQQVIEQIGNLYQSLAALRARIEPLNPRNFSILAEGHLGEIRKLQRDLDEYAGALAADEGAVPLWLRVTGPDIDWRSAPTSVLTSVLDTLRKGVQTVAELFLTGGLATRPTSELKRACDFRVVALSPGSLRVGVRLPDGEQGISIAVQSALRDYLTAAAWAGSERTEMDLEALIPDTRRRIVVLNEVARLVPRERGQVETVEFSGNLVPTAPLVVLQRTSRPRINRAIDRSVEERVETYVGDLREIDLDDCSFMLRNAGRIETETVQDVGVFQIECRFPEELLEAAKEALDKRVEVTGRRPQQEARKAHPLIVNRLQIVEEDRH